MSITGRPHSWTGFSVSVEPTSLTSAQWIQSASSVSEGSLFLQRFRLFCEIGAKGYFLILKMVRGRRLTKPKTFCLFFILPLLCSVLLSVKVLSYGLLTIVVFILFFLFKVFIFIVSLLSLQCNITAEVLCKIFLTGDICVLERQ